MAFAAWCTRRVVKRPRPLDAADALDAVLRSPELRRMLQVARPSPPPSMSTRSWPSSMQAAVQRRMHPDHARCVKEMWDDEVAARRAAPAIVGGAPGDVGGAVGRDGDHCAQGCWDASPGQRRYADGRAIIRSPRAALLSQLEVQRELERTSMRVIHQPPTTPPLPHQDQPPCADGATDAATPLDATVRAHPLSSPAAGHTCASPMKLVDDAPPSPALLAAAARSCAHMDAVRTKTEAATPAASRLATAQNIGRVHNGARRGTRPPPMTKAAVALRLAQQQRDMQAGAGGRSRVRRSPPSLGSSHQRDAEDGGITWRLDQKLARLERLAEQKVVRSRERPITHTSSDPMHAVHRRLETGELDA